MVKVKIERSPIDKKIIITLKTCSSLYRGIIFQTENEIKNNLSLSNNEKRLLKEQVMDWKARSQHIEMLLKKYFEVKL